MYLYLSMNLVIDLSLYVAIYFHLIVRQSQRTRPWFLHWGVLLQ